MTFTNKTIKSEYLNQEFEVSCWEMHQKNGRTLTIIEHAALEDIIFNKMNIEGFSYEITPIASAVNYPVIQCVMSDANGRHIIALGEAHPDSLVNTISRQNPTIMAGNRAFDRAAIRYLNLEGKVYSSDEIPSDNADKEEATEQYTEVNENEELIEQDEVSESGNGYGTVIVNFGKYRGQNKTVAQIWETDESWANYAANMNTDTAGKVTKLQIEAIKAYGETRKGE